MRKRRVGALGLVAAAALVIAGCTPWASQSVPSGTPDLTGISCPSTTHCVAVGGAILTTDDGGATWVSHPGSSAGSVSCPTSNDCVAVGSDISTTSDGGNTWVSQPLPSGANSLSSVSCASNTQCVAVGGTTVSPPSMRAPPG